MSDYNDLHQHIDALRQKGLLIEVDRPSTRTAKCTPWSGGSSLAG